MYDWVDVTVKVPGFAQRVLLLSTAAHSDPTSYAQMGYHPMAWTMERPGVRMTMRGMSLRCTFQLGARVHVARSHITYAGRRSLETAPFQPYLTHMRYVSE